jgi:hypothetical protein
MLIAGIFLMHKIMYAGSETKIGPQSHAGDIIIRFMFWKYLS